MCVCEKLNFILLLQRSHTLVAGLKCTGLNVWQQQQQQQQLHPCTRPQQTTRNYATMRTQQPGSLPYYDVDPYQLLEDDLKDVYSYIKQVRFGVLIKR